MTAAKHSTPVVENEYYISINFRVRDRPDRDFHLIRVDGLGRGKSEKEYLFLLELLKSLF